MTWIPHSSVDECSPTEMNSQRLDQEVVPGVVFERRTMLHVSAATAAVILFGGRKASPAQDGVPPNEAGEDDSGELSWQEFLDQCVPLAKPLHNRKSAAGQDAYLFTIASQAVLLSDVPVKTMKPFRQLDPKYEFEMSYRGFPFFIIHWRMEPNAVLPAHCHPGTSVCTVGLEGEAFVRNFEPEPSSPAYDAAEQTPFLIRETRSELIAPGRISTLSESRDNIHYFQAGPQGARGIDITTQHRGNGAFSFLKFDPDKPKDIPRRLYDAVWVGSNLQHNF